MKTTDSNMGDNSVTINGIVCGLENPEGRKRLHVLPSDP